jgi:hypothetical protein
MGSGAGDPGPGRGWRSKAGGLAGVLVDIPTVRTVAPSVTGSTRDVVTGGAKGSAAAGAVAGSERSVVTTRPSGGAIAREIGSITGARLVAFDAGAALSGSTTLSTAPPDCATGESAPIAGARLGEGSVDASAGWANSADRAIDRANAPKMAPATPSTSATGLTHRPGRTGLSAWSSWTWPNCGSPFHGLNLLAAGWTPHGYQFGGPANSESSVALRPTLAGGLPLTEGET